MIRISSVILFSLLLTIGLNFPAQADVKIQFIENRGQWQDDILYKARIQNGQLLITRKGLKYIFYDSDKLNLHHTGQSIKANEKSRLIDPGSAYKEEMIDLHSVGLYFEDPTEQLEIKAYNPENTYYNYFIGDNPDKWASGVRAYNEIEFLEVYKGISMRLYSQYGHVKYDIIAEPGADVSKIQIRYEGADDIKMEYNSLYIQTPLSTIIENSPYVYQLDGRDTLQVACNFKLKNSVYSFDFPKGYNQKETLCIDPVLVFSTYSGSLADNWGNTATFDKYGNVYSGGTTWDLVNREKIPVSDGAFQTEFGGVWDLAIFKYDSTGSNLLYGTYLGGSDAETPFSLIVNKENELLILGITGSNDFPVLNNSYSQDFQGGEGVVSVIGGVSYLSGSDIFIAKLNETGTELTGSTYYGGTGNDGINDAPGFPLSRNYGDEFRGEINIDDDDNIYIACNTSSEDIPILHGFQEVYGGGTQDAILAKFNSDLSGLLWSTYAGGSFADAAYGIKIADDGSVFTTGGTLSPNFPASSESIEKGFTGDVDAFVAKISSGGDSLIASTYLGTGEYDQAYFIDLDNEENVYVFGQTKGQYPVIGDVYSNPLSGQFIHKLSNALDSTYFSTVIGSGSFIPDISPTAFLVNDCGNIFISGWGGAINLNSPKYNGGNTFDMPVTDNAYQKSTDGSDFYLMVLSANAESLLYATYLGSLNNGPGEHVDGGTSRFDKRGIVYHSICACRDGSQFPTTPGVWSNINGALTPSEDDLDGCNNGVFKFDLASLKADFTTDTWEFDHRGISLGCFPFEVVLLNESIGGKLFQWDYGDGSDKVVQVDSLFHVYENPGEYTVTLRALDENTCQKIDIATKNLTVVAPEFSVPLDETICQFTETRLEASGAETYAWSPEYGLSSTTASNPLASPDSTTTYYLYMEDANQCELFDTVMVEVIPKITTDYSLVYKYNCFVPPSLELINLSENENQITWDLGDQSYSMEDTLLYTYEKSGDYIVQLLASNNGLCEEFKETKVSISEILIPNVITPNDDLKNDTFEIITDAKVDLTITNRWGKVIFQEKDYRNNWAGEGEINGVYYYDIRLNDDVSCNGWIHLLK